MRAYLAHTSGTEKTRLNQTKLRLFLMRSSIRASADMRDRRLLRAEERANQLPVKMVGPSSALRCCR